MLTIKKLFLQICLHLYGTCHRVVLVFLMSLAVCWPTWWSVLIILLQLLSVSSHVFVFTLKCPRNKGLELESSFLVHMSHTCSSSSEFRLWNFSHVIHILGLYFQGQIFIIYRFWYSFKVAEPSKNNWPTYAWTRTTILALWQKEKVIFQ